MDSFVRSCACNGRKPTGVRLERCHARSSLLAKMMVERSAVRFLVAPHLFGKTAAAFGYAQAIFRLQDVFWVEANDPRFLRDLDAGHLADYLLENSPRACLLVLDDMPYLNVDRTERLSHALEILASRGWETVVTTVPSHDNAASLAVPTVRLGVPDLLLDDLELDELARGSLDGRAAANDAAARIPVMAWGTPSERDRFLERLFAEDVPSELLFAHVCLLVLAHGSLSDVERLQGRGSSAFPLLAELYPHLGMDLSAGTFRTAPFPLERIAAAVRPRLERAVLAVRDLSVDEWTLRMADLLLHDGEADRACRVVRTLCSAAARERWLARRQLDLMRWGCMLAAQELADSIARTNVRPDAKVRAIGACRLAWFGDEERARREADALAADLEADSDARLLASALASTLFEEPGAVQSPRANGMPGTMAGLPAADALAKAERACHEAARGWQRGSVSADAFRRQRIRWLALSWLAASAHASERTLAVACDQAEAALFDEDPSLEPLACLLLCSAFDTAARLRREGALSEEASAHLERVRGMAKRLLVRLSRCRRPDVYALRVMDKGAFSVLRLMEDGAPASYIEGLRALGESLDEQRRRWNRTTLPAAPTKRPIGTERTHLSPALGGEIPQLHIKLLGGLEMAVGTERVDPALLRRQKVQTLAALLTLAHGREVATGFLEESLWPDSEPDRARSNLYSTWSRLKRAIEVRPRECPYLTRLQNSCRLEWRHVASDVDEFMELCDRLQFAAPDSTLLPTLFARVEELYAGDLLPSEKRHPVIVRYRTELRNRLVDALISASDRAYKAREDAVALQAARTALFYDEGREDAYNALIRAQTAAGQRSGAMGTYFSCRKYLNDELGIDPSPQTSALYQRLLAEDGTVCEQLALPI